MSETHAHSNSASGRYLALLSLGALGVVYGDIGTSPLYALRECFHGPHAIHLSPANILGVLSLIIWSLIIVISIKYLMIVMRADNRGEGGILALMSLIHLKEGNDSPKYWLLVVLGLFGAALLYGDGVITPAISVLSAVEGLKVATPFFEPYVIPITIVILITLFYFQNKGTARVGRIFGPVMVLWFTTLGLLGLIQMVRQPAVLGAFNPVHGLTFFQENGWHGFLVLGSVFLVVTGGEALYADMGHFGKRPIRVAWFVLVLPGLLLNYLGQGALLLSRPEAAVNPFYNMAPGFLLYPLVLLATAATVIASQALISGAFSLTRQAVQLGYSPRVKIEHTSATEIGQIYIPGVNWALMLGCIGLVLGFRSSSSLAAAYGVAVTATMAITTILLYIVARERWGWSFVPTALLMLFFLGIDLAFFGANIIKVADGGWFPLVLGAVIFTLLTTWKRGRQLLAERLRTGSLPLADFLKDLAANPPQRIPGLAIFMVGNPKGTPPALISNVKHNRVLHERIILLTVVTEEIPQVERERRIEIEPIADGFYRLTVKYGFMEDPDIPAALDQVKVGEVVINPREATYFLGRETLFATKRPGMAIWREKLFIRMARNAQGATSFFCIPVERVIEVGVHVEL